MTCAFSHSFISTRVCLKSVSQLCELIRKKLIGAGVQNGGSQVILMLRHTWAGLASTGEAEGTQKFQPKLCYRAAKPRNPSFHRDITDCKKLLDEKHEIITNICSWSTEKEAQTAKRKLKKSKQSDPLLFDTWNVRFVKKKTLLLSDYPNCNSM